MEPGPTDPQVNKEINRYLDALDRYKLVNISRYLDGFISPIDKMIDSQKLFYLPKCIYFLLCALLGDK